MIKAITDKRKIIDNPPQNIILAVNLPKNILTYEALQKYLWNEYHIDINICQNSDYFEYLFYNNDLRSYMGKLLNFEDQTAVLYILTSFYVPDWEEKWEKLIQNSSILERYDY